MGKLICSCLCECELLRENKNNIERTDWKLRRVIEKFEVGIEKVNHDAIDMSSKNLKKWVEIVQRDRRRTLNRIHSKILENEFCFIIKALNEINTTVTNNQGKPVTKCFKSHNHTQNHSYPILPRFFLIYCRCMLLHSHPITVNYVL